MLLSLKINDVAIIDESNVQYESGLNIMTGETGSGKSIIIDSINAVMGERTSRELIRSGSDCAKVTAIFDDVNSEIISELNELGIDCSDGSLIIQRLIRENRSICKINGEPVNTAILKKIGKKLINIHGQNDNQSLLNPEKHIDFVDIFSDNENIRSEYLEKYNILKQINKELKVLKEAEKNKELRLETLKFQIDEIENANIREGENEELISLKKRSQNIEKVKKELFKAKEILSGNEDNPGIQSGLYDLIAVLKNLKECYPDAENYFNDLSALTQIINECQSFISFENESISDESLDINYIEERLDLIYRLQKKYGGTEQEILHYLDSIKHEYDSLTFNYENLKNLTIKYEDALENLLLCSKKLTDSRKDAAKTISCRVTEELKFLDMSCAEFSVEIKEGPVTSNGSDLVEFYISTNLGQALKPLVKIASGGELSRIMLAIKCVLMNKDKVDTIIFDEIDSGVSGMAAEKIGIKLKEVSEFSQVICVTHLAQIACFADNHLYIEKISDENVSRTKVKKLNYNEKIAEIARIMSGSHISETTLSSAEELINRYISK